MSHISFSPSKMWVEVVGQTGNCTPLGYPLDKCRAIVFISKSYMYIQEWGLQEALGYVHWPLSTNE